MADTTKNTGGIHAGHRTRLRERFLREGLSSFQEHEVLELLLTYAIPQRDVNPLAHELIVHFGSLANVLNASESELKQVKGVGANAASLLSLMPQLLGRYQLSRMGEHPIITNLAEASAYCEALFLDAHEERVYMICVDQAGHVLHPALVRTGTLDEVPLYPREAVEIALRYDAFAVLIAHNHPSGIAYPSMADYEVTKMIVAVLGMISVHVVDHLIVAPSSVYSMAQHSELGDTNLPDDFTYKTRSSVVPGTRGTLRAQDDDGWNYLTLEKLERSDPQ